MELAYAVLLPDDVQTFMRRHTIQLVRRHRLSPFNVILPPHITVKQPFPARETAPFERYLDELASSLDLFELVVGGFGFFEGESGIVFLAVRGEGPLRALQQRIMRELAVEPGGHERPGPVPHQFHATIAHGLTPEQLADARTTLANAETPAFRFTVERIGLFVFSDTGRWALHERTRTS